ncbi:MAG: hypothetical protein IJP75_04095 [Bacteroidaceae bacterium]|nr:hypothetical protein [Bacteroidaceae bacterium]
MRDSIATDLFTMDNYEMLVKLRKYMNKLKAQFTTKEEEKYISKEELLAGIDAGLKEMKMGLGRPARDFLNELRQS